MHHAAPPTPCRADVLQRYVSVQGATQGLSISIGLYADGPCLLPSRPQVQILVSGRPVTLRRVPLRLSADDVPRRVIAPKRPATAILRWQNWCGRRRPVSLRLTLGGISTVDQFGSATTRAPVCVDPHRPSMLGVSLFVRR